MSNIIKRANELNSSHYRLKEVTQKVLALAIEQAQHIGVELVLAGTKTIVVADYYAKVYGCTPQTAYEALKTAVEDMYYAEYIWSEKTSKGVNEYRTRFVSHIGYLGGEGAIEFVLTEKAREHIINLTKNFTLYEIKQLTHLGKYGIRLYELLAQWRSVGQVEFGLEELRTKLGLIPSEYQFLGNFKARVLDVAVKELNEHTDFKVKYINVKEGRTVVGFKFTFKQMKKIVENKTLISRENSLTDSEKAITKSVADQYIAKNNITAEHYKINIYNQALRDGWGLERQANQNDYMNAENAKVLARIETDNQSRCENEKKAKQNEKENIEFISYFESLPQSEQNKINEQVKEEVRKLPIIGNKFKADSYKDIMYRIYFKKVMNFKN